jgi:hypothetical protein
MGQIERQQALVDQLNAKLVEESQHVFEGDAHALLVATYQGRYKPSQQQLRAAYKAIEYEKARLQATAILRDENNFSMALDRAIARSGRAPLMIEAKAIETPQPE